MSEAKQCPLCGETILQVAIKCRFCGSMLSGESPSAGSLQWIAATLASKFDIRREVGRGGMASIYQGYQKNLSREVAIKVIHPHLLGNQDFVKRFINEGRSAAKLDHPNIIKVYDTGAIGEIYYLSMELLHGTDLSTYIREKGKLTTEEAIRIVAQIADALNYIHKHGMVHRDIKCSNIFIKDDGTPVLMDFGIIHASENTKLTMTGTVLGTPHFTSPEQAKGQPADKQSDIYSLGVIMFLCISGKLPYSGENELSIITKIISETPIPIMDAEPSCPKWLADIIHKAMARDAKDRFENGSEISDALNRRSNVPEKINGMVFVQGGTFQMGSNDGEIDEKPIHSVTVSDFYIDKYQVTVKQFRDFCDAVGRRMPVAPSWGWLETHPIVHVSWNDATAYAKWAGKRLPTEAEWEYAARGGNQGKGYKYAGSNNHDEVRLYGGKSGRKTHPVGVKKPNELGLYDMSGNVWEWVSDWYGSYPSGSVTNPRGPSSGEYHILRGGSWFSEESLINLRRRRSSRRDLPPGGVTL